MAQLNSLADGGGNGTLSGTSVTTTLVNNDIIDAPNHPSNPRECTSAAENPVALTLTLTAAASTYDVLMNCVNSVNPSDPEWLDYGLIVGTPVHAVDSEYRFTLTLVNTSPNYWQTVKLQLGWKIAGVFTESNTPDFLDFDAPARVPAPTNNFPGTPGTTFVANSLEWSAVIPPGTYTLTFGVDFPETNDKMLPATDYTPSGSAALSVDSSYQAVLRVTTTAGAVFIATGTAGIAATCGHPISHTACVADEV